MRTLKFILFSKSTTYARMRMMIIVTVLVFVYLGLRDFIDYRYKQSHGKPPARVAEQDIVIPFELKNGWITLDVTIENRYLKAIYDTGSASSFISENPTKPFKSFVVTKPQEHGWGGMIHPGYIPKLTLSNISFVDVPFYLSYEVKSHFSYFPDGEPLRCILGNEFFNKYVVTIDYPRKCLVLRNSKYNISEIRISPPASLLNITYICGKDTVIPSVIMFPGTLGGIKTHFMMDTGYYQGGILTTSGFVNKHFQNKQKTLSSISFKILDRNIEYEIMDIPWAIGGLEGKCNTFVLSDTPYSNNIYDPVEVIIGYDQLRDCRITIDYKRKKVLIERTIDIRNTDFSLQSDIKPFYGTQPPPTPHLPGSNLRWDQKPDGTWHEMPIN